ncbi:P-loop containing nucleoside triphosphate hydrolase protein [Coprinopsis marcescibilis]|uniref:P-loop containing nucleoside triphosphate hydrolase protein n=1 Tax=Coprinopsis marcescibilis TaxID=230819 RepID=A0A5C3L075_COPMA|nr:P-loop containing nucleoside triphosphate hydrolase protein [Coprinopsis marcescibilis]
MSRTSSTDEKSTVVNDQKTKRNGSNTELNEKGSDNASSTKIVDTRPNIPAVSFFSLFRFTTKFEFFIDFIALLAAAAAGAAQPLMSLLFGNLTNDFVNFQTIVGRAAAGNETAAALVPAAAQSFREVAALDASYLVYIGVGMFACTYTYMYVWVYTGEVNAKRLREAYLQAVLRQDIAYFDNVGAGEVATRIQTDTHLVQQATSEKVAMTINFLGAFLCGFILAFVRSWRLALAMSSILPCMAIAGGVMNKFISAYKQLSLQYIADGGTLAEEVISTVRTAQAFGTQKILATIYDGHVQRSFVVDMKSSVWHGAGLGFFFFVIYASYGLAFHFGTTLILQGYADSGAVVNVFMAILIGSISLTLLAPEIQALTHGCGAAAKLYETIDRVPNIDSANEGGLKPEPVVGEITFENITFSYPSRPDVQVVKGLSLTFRAGRTAALVGASGSGKSTAISLIERFYDPLTGSVKLDGVDLKELNVKWLRSQIGLVSQEPTLFATSIRGNVAHGLIGTKYENAPEEEKFELIKQACVKANADIFISKLPEQYDTMVGERGFLLSGGQKQRIAIARAIVSDPRILLLDEATSALDTQSEGIVQDALDKAAAGRTTITIAHRLSTVKDADVIYVMGDGLVLEQGSHNQLLEASGPYAHLVQAQQLREASEQHRIEDGSEYSEDAAAEKGHPEDLALGRQNTGHSLASAIIEKRRLENDTKETGDVSIYVLFKRMALLVPDQWRNYSFAIFFACCTGMVYPVVGIVYAMGMAGFAQEGEEKRKAGDRNALWFFIIAIVASICVALQNYYFATAAAALTARLRTSVFKAILRQDVEFFDKDENSTGSLTANLSENPQKVNGLAGITLGAIIQSFATLIGGSVIGLAYIWKVALVGIACTPLLVSTGFIRLKVVVLKDQANKKAHEESAQLACEAAGSIRTVAALTREKDCLRLYSESLDVPLQRSNRTAIWGNLLFALSQAIVFFVIALVFWYGSVLVSNFEADTLQFFVGLMSTTFGAVQAGNVFSFVPDVSTAKGAGSDIIKLLDSIPEVDAESEEGEKLANDTVKGHLKLDNIHFRYPTRPGVRVLRGMSVEIQPGTYVALVGASGSGKSTVIQMIERFYDPLSGEVLLDGKKITDLNIQDYRKHIALVSQEPTLYSGSIRFNIMLGAIKPQSEVTQEELEAACRNANILDFIKSLPQGFDTEVGGKGSQLSGGQKQRIAIARALLRNPKVLLLDEATSALDSHSEKVVQAALDQAAKGRTTIAIAHRLSTIQNADKIYFVKEGRVSESGTHDQLLAQRGDYYEYVQLQALSANE